MSNYFDLLLIMLTPDGWTDILIGFTSHLGREMTNGTESASCSWRVVCRQYGPLTGDLIAVLLQADPAARPTAQQVLAIPAVRPYAEAYVRRMRAIAERCVSPATPLSTPSAEHRDTHTGNDVTPEPEASGSGDRTTCGNKQESDEKRSFLSCLS